MAEWKWEREETGKMTVRMKKGYMVKNGARHGNCRAPEWLGVHAGADQQGAEF